MTFQRDNNSLTKLNSYLIHQITPTNVYLGSPKCRNNSKAEHIFPSFVCRRLSITSRFYFLPCVRKDDSAS
jgi:hypothetical protein